MSDIDKPIERVLGAYAAAVLAKDVGAFMRLYDPDVRVFDAWGVWSYEGAEAWQIAVEGWFASLGAERARVAFADVKTVAGRDLTVVSAIVGYTALAATGEALRSMENRITWTLKTSGHVPRIVHEHTSAPIGFDDQKAILSRAGASP